MKLAAGAFLAGAASRLLPPSIPFRFFGAAVAYHLLGWIVLFASAPGVPRFTAGLGWPLAALHLMTLGVLAMAAIGASLQLLPVATRQPVRFKRWPAMIWWVYAPGVAAVVLGMGIPAPRLLAGGAVAVIAGLGGYGLLLGRNLIGAKGMPVVVAHGWAALASLVVLLATALSLACAYLGSSGFERNTALSLHVTFAAYGFMGLLALGLSYILVPMFALSAAPDERSAWTSLTLAVTALLLSAAAASGIAQQPLRMAAIGAGAVAVALHLRLMSVALGTGMRRELGPSFTLVRIAWFSLVASLAAALGVAIDAPGAAGIATLFGILLVGGWLLTFLIGILQRIIPFLASMHAAPGKRLPPTPSSLTAQRPLSIHFVCHLAALALLALAVVTGSERVASAGALIGSVGAAAFGGFFLIVLRRMSARDREARPRQACAG